MSAQSKWLRIALLVFLGLVAADLLLLAINWPFTRRAVIKSLEEAASAPVEIQGFRSFFFPYPGCLATNVTIHHPGDSGPPLITISTFEIRGNYWRLLRFSKNLTLVHSDGAHIRFRAGKSKNQGRSSDSNFSVTVDTLLADRTVLEFASKESGKPPFVISVRHARLSPVSAHRPLNFETDLHIPTPPGDIHSSGQFGPWNVNDPFATQASGTYAFQHADLGFTGGMAGVLESRGSYHGPIRQIDINGSTTVPDFRVADVNHPVDFTTRFRATVNGETGDTVLHEIAAHLAHTEITGSGAVAPGKTGDGKVASFTLAVPNGRIEDFLFLLTSSARPTMVGALQVRTTASLPPGPEPFLKKLQMNGEFQIARGRFTMPSTEESLDRIRDKSRRDPVNYAADALSNLGGRASVGGGVAHFSNVSFEAPGVSARLSGTFDLLTTRADLHGTAHLDSSLSSATTGVKSVLLKFLNPFFKSRSRKGSTVPIKLTGTYGHTTLGLDLSR